MDSKLFFSSLMKHQVLGTHKLANDTAFLGDDYMYFRFEDDERNYCKVIYNKTTFEIYGII